MIDKIEGVSTYALLQCEISKAREDRDNTRLRRLATEVRQLEKRHQISGREALTFLTEIIDSFVF